MIVITCRYWWIQSWKEVIFFVQLFMYKKAGIKCCFKNSEETYLKGRNKILRTKETIFKEAPVIKLGTIGGGA